MLKTLIDSFKEDNNCAKLMNVIVLFWTAQEHFWDGGKKYIQDRSWKEKDKSHKENVDCFKIRP